MKRSMLLPLVIAGLVVAGCSSNDGNGDADATSSPTPGSGANPLRDTSWDLVSYSGDAATTPTKVPASVTATASFDATRVSGIDGCNNYSGSYSVEEDAIRFEAIASTQKACSGAAGEVSAVFLTALGSAQTFTVSDSTLTITGEGGNGATVTLTFAPAKSASLTATTWEATGINNGKGAVTSLVNGTTLTAEFGDDDTLSGNAGCNTYNGPYTATGTSIDIGALATTKKLCEQDVNEQEAAYLAALDASTRYTIRGNVLELRDDAGALQVSYSAR